MTKNLIITVLSVLLIASYWRLNVLDKTDRASSLAPNVRHIEWPEELPWLIMDDSTFVATMEFKMNGPDSLVVGFYHDYSRPSVSLVNVK